MKVVLICRSFDKNSGQGIYKMAGYLYENLRKHSKLNILKIEDRKTDPFYFDLIESPLRVIKEKSDVFHFLMSEVSLPILLWKKIQEKSIVTIHDAIIYKIKERRWVSEKYMKVMYKIAKAAKFIITPSSQSKNDLINFLKIPEEKITVIPWGVDLDFFKPRKKEKREKIAGYVGGLGKRKNVEWVIKAAKKFESVITFKIAGKGPQLRELISLKDKQRIKNVEFVGFIPENELPNFYNSLDIFIFPSLFEGFSIPLLEAMACEVPYIIGTNAGMGEILPIYKIKSFEELKELLTKIKDEKLKPLKNTKRWIIENKLMWKNHVRKLIKVYEKVI